MRSRPAAARRPLASSPFRADPPPVIEAFAPDDRVTHDTHGLGRVVAQDQNTVTVDFGTHQVRVPSPFTKLTKL